MKSKKIKAKGRIIQNANNNLTENIAQMKYKRRRKNKFEQKYCTACRSFLPANGDIRFVCGDFFS